jgi:hypothetical protein
MLTLLLPVVLSAASLGAVPLGAVPLGALALGAPAPDSRAPEPESAWAWPRAKPVAVAVEAPVATRLQYTVDGLVDEGPVHVVLRPEGPATVAVTVAERPDWRAALVDGAEGWSVSGGEPALVEALQDWLASGVLVREAGWGVGEDKVLVQRFSKLSDRPIDALPPRCSCPMGVTDVTRETVRVLATDGWPVLAVVVTDTLHTTLAGGSQHWGSQRGEWVQTTWLREGGPDGLVVRPGAARGAWAQPRGPHGEPLDSPAVIPPATR